MNRKSEERGRKAEFPLIPKRFLPWWTTAKQYRNVRRIRLFLGKVTLPTQFFTFKRARSSSPSFLSGARRQSSVSLDRVIF